MNIIFSIVSIISFPLFIYALSLGLYQIKLFAYYADYITNAFPILFEFLCLTLLVVAYKIIKFKFGAKLPQIIKPFGFWVGVLLTAEIMLLDVAGYNIFYSSYYPSSYFATSTSRLFAWLISGTILFVVWFVFKKYKLSGLSIYALFAIFIYALIANILPNNIILYMIFGAFLTLSMLSMLLFYAHVNKNHKLFKFIIFLIILRLALFIISH